jgi:hypothetical protein
MDVLFRWFRTARLDLRSAQSGTRKQRQGILDVDATAQKRARPGVASREPLPAAEDTVLPKWFLRVGLRSDDDPILTTIGCG